MDNKQKSLWNGWVIIFISLAIVLILVAIISPFLYYKWVGDKILDTAKDGTFGYTIGGLVSPFIAVSGVIVTGLAFYMQLKANQIQIENFQTELQNQKATFEKQFNTQQDESRINHFESQFYEMLRLHKENVNEIQIEVYRKLENTVYDTSNNSGHLFGRKTSSIEKTTAIKEVKGRDVFIYFANELEIAFKIYTLVLKDNLEAFNFTVPYSLFFNGINALPKSDFKHRAMAEKETFYHTVLNKDLKITFQGVNIISYYPLFEGHENKLGHYYRHLYHTVKFVVFENDFLDYAQKRNYLRILRAQLSNYEQAMLFYNYLAFAPEWEEGNKFLTDYRMIHNLYRETLISDDYFTQEYDRLKSYQNTAPFYKENDYIFESQKWD